jgi:uncharacterized damage-inducible protein DinB
MTDHHDTLNEIYAGWEQYQTHLIDALTPLTPDQLALRLAPHLRPIGLLAGHIISARAYWFHYLLGEGSTDLFKLMDYDEEDEPPHPAAELVSALQATWAVMAAAFQRWNADDLAQTFTRTQRGETSVISRRWVVWHLIEHDLHHGGELFYTLGAHSLPTPDI